MRIYAPRRSAPRQVPGMTSIRCPGGEHEPQAGVPAPPHGSKPAQSRSPKSAIRSGQTGGPGGEVAGYFEFAQLDDQVARANRGGPGWLAVHWFEGPSGPSSHHDLTACPGRPANPVIVTEAVGSCWLLASGAAPSVYGEGKRDERSPVLAGQTEPAPGTGPRAQDGRGSAGTARRSARTCVS
jgi:hypothetical protein